MDPLAATTWLRIQPPPMPWDRAIERCATTLNARMSADGQEPSDWDYSRTIHDRAELTRTS